MSVNELNSLLNEVRCFQSMYSVVEGVTPQEDVILLEINNSCEYIQYLIETLKQ